MLFFPISSAVLIVICCPGENNFKSIYWPFVFLLLAILFSSLAHNINLGCLFPRCLVFLISLCILDTNPLLDVWIEKTSHSFFFFLLKIIFHTTYSNHNFSPHLLPDPTSHPPQICYSSVSFRQKTRFPKNINCNKMQ